MAKEQSKKKSGVWDIYEKKGGKVERRNKFCPKCGSGFFMAKHSNRWACGNCHYCEFVTSKKIL